MNLAAMGVKDAVNVRKMIIKIFFIVRKGKE
jgi:hypothetical protein